MIHEVLEFFPAFVFFFAALASLILDFRKRSSLVFILLVQATALVLVLSQSIFPAPGREGANFIASTPNAFMIMTCVVNSFFITVTMHGDFKDGTIDKFTHVLVFLILGNQALFLYADSLFLLGTCMFTTFMFLSLLKFIYPSVEKRTLNVLIAVNTTGYISFMIGCLIVHELAGATNVALSTMNAAAVPDMARMFLFTGSLLMLGAFPFSIAIHQNLFKHSHVSVKMLDVVFFIGMYWKFIDVFLSTGLMQPAFVVIIFLAGIASVLTGSALIAKEFDKAEKDIVAITTHALVADLGWILTLFGVLGESIVTGGEGESIPVLSSAIMVQLLVVLGTKMLLIAAVKNVQIIFQSDILERMGGIKATKPVTLVAFLLGTTGTIFSGIFVLDAIHVALGLGGSPASGIVAFWMMVGSFLFTATWTALVVARVFGGKDVPIVVKNLPPFELTNEHATILPMIGLNMVLLVALLAMPSIAFVGFMLPA